MRVALARAAVPKLMGAIHAKAARRADGSTAKGRTLRNRNRTARALTDAQRGDAVFTVRSGVSSMA
jgi:hypothetical protein